MNQRTLLTVALLVMTAAWRGPMGAAAAPPDETVSGEVGARLDRYLTRLSPFGFSGAVLVARRGRVLLHKGYGWADRGRRLPNTTRTAFDIASLTKQFTAAAILKLEAQGKLRTGDVIGRHLRGVPPDKAGITIHHLMTHTSGLPGDFSEGRQLTREQFLDAALKTPLAAEPGRRFLYANSGYNLLAAIIEVVSGESYPAFLAEALFKPAGMSETGCYDDRARWAGAAVARGYNESSDHSPLDRLPDWRVRGAYDVLTTVGDLDRWVAALREGRVLGAAAGRKLFAPQAATGQPGVDYGYGWNIAQAGKLVSHGGSHYEGFNASYRYSADEDLVIIVTANRIFGRLMPLTAVEPALSRIAAGEAVPEAPEGARIEPQAPEQHAGTYQFPSGAQLTVEVEDDHLRMGAAGQEAIDLLIAADAGERRAHADFNARAGAIFEGVGRGDFGAAEREMGGRVPPAEIRGALGALWRQFTERHGAFKSIEVVGTVPETEATMTYVRMDFERGSEYRRCRWERGRLAYILQGGPPLIPTSFVAQSPAEFRGYHVVIGRAVRARFERQALTIEGVAARKK